MKDLNAAFRFLRKEGLIARQNFLCCSGCAGASIADDTEDMIDAGKTRESIKGCVFFHKQSGADRAESGRFYLQYGSVDTAKYGTIGLPTKEVGDLVASALRAENIDFEWNGDANQAILVIES